MSDMSEKFKGSYTKLYLSDLTQHPASAWIYTPRGIKPLADSITAFGGLVHNPKVTKPDVDGKCRVLSGWRRVMACRQLGWEYMFVEVMNDLPEEDENLFIVECNNHREKTPREKYYEIRVYEEELPKRQGTRTDLADGEKYDQRKAIAEKMDIAESEVRDLKIIGAAPNGDELLDSIDGKTVTLTAAARKVKEMASGHDYSGYVAVEQIDLEPLPCPTCNCYLTKRIEVIDRHLFYVN